MDKATESRSRIHFVRVCVEVGQEADMPDSIAITTEGIVELEVQVEYPWKPIACTLCSKFGWSQ